MCSSTTLALYITVEQCGNRSNKFQRKCWVAAAFSKYPLYFKTLTTIAILIAALFTIQQFDTVIQRDDVCKVLCYCHVVIDDKLMIFTTFDMSAGGVDISIQGHIRDLAHGKSYSISSERYPRKKGCDTFSINTGNLYLLATLYSRWRQDVISNADSLTIGQPHGKRSEETRKKVDDFFSETPVFRKRSKLAAQTSGHEKKRQLLLRKRLDACDENKLFNNVGQSIDCGMINTTKRDVDCSDLSKNHPVSYGCPSGQKGDQQNLANGLKPRLLDRSCESSRSLSAQSPFSFSAVTGKVSSLCFEFMPKSFYKQFMFPSGRKSNDNAKDCSKIKEAETIHETAFRDVGGQKDGGPPSEGNKTVPADSREKTHLGMG